VESLVEIPRSQWKANTDPLAAYVEALSLTRLALRNPADVENERDDVPGFADLFDRYRNALRSQGAIDFDEQIYGAIEALLVDGAARRRAQAEVRHVLVDEFQDLTPAHVLLLRLLCLPQLDCFGVGDDDQVIYGHAGADPSFLIDFAGLFPGASLHALETNYRCAVPIVDAARHLLGYNRRRVAKEIRPAPDAVGGVERLRVVSPKMEDGATALVALVRGWLDEPGVSPNDIAVLTRVNSLLLAPQVALAEAGIPVRSTVDDSLLSRTGLRAAFAYLRIGTAGDKIDPSDLTEILRRPSRGLPQWFPERLRRKKSWSLKDLRNIAATVSDRDADKVIRFVGDLQLVVDACRRGATGDVLRVIRDDVGLAGAMSLLDASKGGEGSSHLDDLEALAQVAPLHPDPVTFVPWLTDRLRESGDTGVTLSTVHRVKGREWDRVVVFGVAAGLLPHRLTEDIEAERRVLHVGITRGRNHVVVLSDQLRPSPFLAELTGVASHTPIAISRPVSPGARPGVMAPKSGSGKPPVEELAPDAEVRFQKLRAWRSERARRDKVSPFIVAPDRTLRAIAKAAPSSLVQLSRVEGIGPTKLDAYGEEILGVLE
jgi:DNA helicase II / ATP-dependent DNA helicase PcrA